MMMMMDAARGGLRRAWGGSRCGGDRVGAAASGLRGGAGGDPLPISAVRTPLTPPVSTLDPSLRHSAPPHPAISTLRTPPSAP